MADDSQGLAARRGRPISEYGGLFPGGRLWLSILGVSYAGLVALEAIGNEAWRVAATPYLDIGLCVGLVPSIWRVTRPATRHEENAEMREAAAALADAPVDLIAESGLADEDGKLIDEPPPAWVDELTPERTTFDLGQAIWRGIATAALSFAAWIGLLIGLAAIDWARGHWLVTAAIAAALAGVVWMVWRSARADAAKAG
jgi:hypothetical protein